MIAARTRTMRRSAARARPEVLVRTPGKSRKMRGGPSTVPIVGAGRGPFASIVITASPPTTDDEIRCTIVGPVCARAGSTAPRQIATARTSAARAGREPAGLLNTADFISELQGYRRRQRESRILSTCGGSGPHVVSLVTPQSAFIPPAHCETVNFWNEYAKSRVQLHRQTDCDNVRPRTPRVATHRPARARHHVADCPPGGRVGGCRDPCAGVIRCADARAAAQRSAAPRHAPRASRRRASTRGRSVSRRTLTPARPATRLHSDRTPPPFLRC